MIDHHQFLSRELLRLDLLLHLEISRLRARYQLSLDEFRGLYVSHDQVDAMLRNPEKPNQSPEETLQRVAALRRSSYRDLSPQSPWAHLIREFALEDAEADVVLITLAPELDLKYELLYSYLNNDVTRKCATRDLAFRLLSQYGRASEWLTLGPWAKLFRSGLLQSRDSDKGGLRQAQFSLNPVVAAFLVGALSPLDSAPAAGWADLDLPERDVTALREIALRLRESPGRPHVVLEGNPGCGRIAAAAAICADLGVTLNVVSPPLALEVEEIALDNRLRRAALFVRNMLGADDGFSAEANRLLPLLEGGSSPVFWSVPMGWNWHDALRGRVTSSHKFEIPSLDFRRSLWQREAERRKLRVSPVLMDALSSRFAFNAGQIRNTVRTLTGTSPDTFFAAARGQTTHGLARYAQLLPLNSHWNDLVLPPATLRHLREVAGAVEHRHIVQAQWCMRMGEGGLNVLFAGPSGTGKSLSASVIARHLGLDCYKISIPGIVSKYIGETERNLERLFQAARQSNAILLFDEADALFGKRSEVKDSHDRYANLEVAYLLQKMEEHDGIVILATNMMNNVDDAFSRRLQFVVEFPLPAEPHREKLWRLMFPANVPLAPGIDFKFLARQFELSGGQIRTASLDAAFLAVQNSTPVTMQLLIRAVARQFAKQRRIPSVAEFQNYFPVLLERDVARQ